MLILIKLNILEKDLPEMKENVEIWVGPIKVYLVEQIVFISNYKN